MNLVLTKKQERKFRKDYTDDQGNPCVLVATVRYGDECGNGHNTFAITANLYDCATYLHGEPRAMHKPTGKELWLGSCGCLHDEVAEHFPALAPFIKWHLTSSDGPLHYIANALYCASDRDCNGLRKGEVRQIRNGKTGALAWTMKAADSAGNIVDLHTLSHKYFDGDTPPDETYTVSWKPWNRIGEGKEPDLEAARRIAMWPDAQLEDFTKKKLEARLPALREEFKRDVESLGFTF